MVDRSQVADASLDRSSGCVEIERNIVLGEAGGLVRDPVGFFVPWDANMRGYPLECDVDISSAEDVDMSPYIGGNRGSAVEGALRQVRDGRLAVGTDAELARALGRDASVGRICVGDMIQCRFDGDHLSTEAAAQHSNRCSESS